MITQKNNAELQQEIAKKVTKAEITNKEILNNAGRCADCEKQCRITRTIKLI